MKNRYSVEIIVRTSYIKESEIFHKHKREE